ncbi:hypothetical protein EYZ11_013133 [Aspergillus tanneri]|uniref:Uncharacterized protein n=1 Tax=Aspergillus tanneri TaxID=1220188 RepID=A0A4S3IYY3_9EURO|nr:hypothetical protein EYZ11_013133 [Aspergillus tanneri]
MPPEAVVNAINVARKWAVIPGDDLHEWSEVSCFAEVTVSFNKILPFVERARRQDIVPEFDQTGFEGSGKSDEAILSLFHHVAVSVDISPLTIRLWMDDSECACHNSRRSHVGVDSD